MRRIIAKISIFLALLAIVLTSSPLLIGKDLSYGESVAEIGEGSLPVNSTDHHAIIRSDETVGTEPEITVSLDFGLNDVYLELNAPHVLPLYNTLVCEVDVLNAEPGLKGVLTWFLDEKVVLEELITIGSEIPSISHDFEYNRSTAEEVHVKVSLKYLTEKNMINEAITEKIVSIENYNKMHWIDLEAPRVLEEVTSRYAGNRTLQWAIDNDYDEFDKEVFVNAMGYESETEYLLWVSRSHQRLNVFTKSSEVWELIETFIISTGAPGTATRRGVTTIPSRSAEGWYFDGYFVRPVVRFYPGTGYAFHSRLLRHGGSFRDARIGFPVSAGCIRMYCDDIWYVYNNIPDGTTVVIY